jgi:hypothetical protein
MTHFLRLPDKLQFVWKKFWFDVVLCCKYAQKWQSWAQNPGKQNNYGIFENNLRNILSGYVTI